MWKIKSLLYFWSNEYKCNVHFSGFYLKRKKRWDKKFKWYYVFILAVNLKWNQPGNVSQPQFSNSPLCLICLIFVSFSPSCPVTGPGVFWGCLHSNLMGIGGLCSIWLTWKQLCFHRSDWGFIAPLSRPGFTRAVCLNNVKSHVSHGSLKHHYCHSYSYFFQTQCM